MKILMLNGSPRANGNTAAALREMEAVFADQGIDTETIHIGHREIRGCIVCGRCAELARNMAFLVKSIALGREQFGLPELESRQATNFIR